MNTIPDIVAFNRERASRHIHDSDRAWWVGGIVVAALFVVLIVWFEAFSPHTASPQMNHLGATVNTR